MRKWRNVFLAVFFLAWATCNTVNAQIATTAHLAIKQILPFHLLQSFDPPSATTSWSKVSALADLSGDGVPELLVGTQSIYGGSLGGFQILSALGGPAFFQMDGFLTGYTLSSSNGPAGDVNQDGTPDFLVTIAPDILNSSTYVVATSRNVGDTDGDGVGDILLQTSYDNDLYLYSGKTGTLLWSKPVLAQALFSSALGIGMGDINGDGASDILIGREPVYTGSQPGVKIIVLSGKDGALLFEKELLPPAGVYNPQIRLSSPGDLNGDGKDEILVSVNWKSPYVLDGASKLQIGQLPAPSPFPATSTLYPAFSLEEDFSGDGKRDIQVKDLSTGRLYLYGL